MEESMSIAIKTLLKSEIFRSKALWCPAIHEVINYGLIVTRVSDEAHHLVAQFVVILDTWAIKSVVFDSSQVPRCVLESLEFKSVEKAIYNI